MLQRLRPPAPHLRRFSSPKTYRENAEDAEKRISLAVLCALGGWTWTRRARRAPPAGCGRIGPQATRPLRGSVDVNATCERVETDDADVRIGSSQCGHFRPSPACRSPRRATRRNGGRFYRGQLVHIDVVSALELVATVFLLFQLRVNSCCVRSQPRCQKSESHVAHTNDLDDRWEMDGACTLVIARAGLRQCAKTTHGSRLRISRCGML